MCMMGKAGVSGIYPLKCHIRDFLYKSTSRLGSTQLIETAIESRKSHMMLIQISIFFAQYVDVLSNTRFARISYLRLVGSSIRYLPTSSRLGRIWGSSARPIWVAKTELRAQGCQV